jgi:hypothetical protein
MPLANAANRGIAGHGAQSLDIVREQQSSHARASGRKGRLGTGMATANHNHIETGRKLHATRPKQKEAQSYASRSKNQTPSHLVSRETTPALFHVKQNLGGQSRRSVNLFTSASGEGVVSETRNQ